MHSGVPQTGTIVLVTPMHSLEIPGNRLEVHEVAESSASAFTVHRSDMSKEREQKSSVSYRPPVRLVRVYHLASLQSFLQFHSGEGGIQPGKKGGKTTW